MACIVYQHPSLASLARFARCKHFLRFGRLSNWSKGPMWSSGSMWSKEPMWSNVACASDAAGDAAGIYSQVPPGDRRVFSATKTTRQRFLQVICLHDPWPERERGRDKPGQRRCVHTAPKEPPCSYGPDAGAQRPKDPRPPRPKKGPKSGPKSGRKGGRIGHPPRPIGGAAAAASASRVRAASHASGGDAGCPPRPAHPATARPLSRKARRDPSHGRGGDRGPAGLPAVQERRPAGTCGGSGQRAPSNPPPIPHPLPPNIQPLPFSRGPPSGSWGPDGTEREVK